MSILVKQESHNNGISIFYDSHKKLFSKVAFDNKSINILKNEIKGFDWYNYNFINTIDIKPIYISDVYLKLIINKIYGKKINYGNSISQNYLYLKNFSDFYQNYWPNNNFRSPIHGDLTLDNIFFKKKYISIFDWENYSDIELDWGYDLCYLILSAFYLPQLLNKKIKKKDKYIFKKLWNNLKNMKINNNLIFHPFDYLINVYETDIVWSDINRPNKSKFLPYMLDISQKNIFFEIIN